MSCRLLISAMVLMLLTTTSTILSPSLVDAQSYAPSGKRRGTYISIYSSSVLNFQLAPHGLNNILGDTTKENKLLTFLKNWEFNAISLYNLHVVLASPTLSTKLRSFIKRARQNGIYNVEAVGGAVNADYQRINNYQKNVATNDNERFDGVVTEIEFWHSGGSVSDLTGPLNYARGLNTPGRGTKSFYYCSYLGWVPQSDFASVITVIDYMWPHSYVLDQSSTNQKLSWLYGLTDDRIHWMQQAIAQNSAIATNSIKVVPIFSAEGTQYKAGSQVFSGDFLKYKESLTFFETTYENSWNQATTFNLPKPATTLVSGFQWYEYVFVSLYLKDATPPNTGTIAPASSPNTGGGTSSQSGSSWICRWRIFRKLRKCRKASPTDDSASATDDSANNGSSSHNCGTGCHVGMASAVVVPVLVLAFAVGIIMKKKSELKKRFSNRFDIVAEENLDDENPDDKPLEELDTEERQEQMEEQSVGLTTAAA